MCFICQTPSLRSGQPLPPPPSVVTPPPSFPDPLGSAKLVSCAPHLSKITSQPATVCNARCMRPQLTHVHARLPPTVMTPQLHPSQPSCFLRKALTTGINLVPPPFRDVQCVTWLQLNFQSLRLDMPVQAAARVIAAECCLRKQTRAVAHFAAATEGGMIGWPLWRAPSAHSPQTPTKHINAAQHGTARPSTARVQLTCRKGAAADQVARSSRSCGLTPPRQAV
jgi:hypothetical protein